MEDDNTQKNIMKKSKHISLFFVLLISVLLFSCQKEDVDIKRASVAELQFEISFTGFDFKTLDDSVPQCQDYSMDYVVFELDNEIYTSPIMNANGRFLTKTVKLPAGYYTLSRFMVYHTVLQGDDILVKAAPLVGSTYHDLMVNKLDLEISIEPFKKKQISVDVLCYEELFAQEFGFSWFDIHQMKIEKQCFFGDLCIPNDYVFEGSPYIGSLYQSQSNGLQSDMPAIMEVKVYKEGTLIRTFSNADWATPGEGDCMEVYYANDENLQGENFTYEVYVLKPDAANEYMVYELMATIDFQDEEGADIGPAYGETNWDGVVDFVVGNCNIDNTDYSWDY
ncbi:MAG: hypothetical protein B7C24_11765 [Bacteroidetes bacterium 4572_77]|nr:MAG: hypothetical protein B7C24_11765 [Bacteroidetes bacterium 4572_77]